ncbi:uncharacterized protein BDZ99DRAFT_516157 [Mytilinidion resinicola]|uniref:Amino acid permease/ SLC12A domain-containing protein n=1 Tax=Mytilinidion resinicola TaxID=574789 RepID=A0A6A6Z564_9PEZI|nr:uncharacterized protein BDZ99DRAFT_516157 [Mytilinidion resinicola]KAF2815434.1 hypothetical protein BDZ99DRAFT_516157 [Mytilinidion resinicola]
MSAEISSESASAISYDAQPNKKEAFEANEVQTSEINHEMDRDISGDISTTDYAEGPSFMGINGFGQVFVLAAAYYVGTEIVSLAAAESKNPQRDVLRVDSLIFCILTFKGNYSLMTSRGPIPSLTEYLASSPFTIGFELAGWKPAGHFVNAITVVAFISAGNGVVYVQSRTLFSLAKTGRAPKIFSTTTKRGVPWAAILPSTLWGFLSLMNRKRSAGAVFSYIPSVVGGTAAYTT